MELGAINFRNKYKRQSGEDDIVEMIDKAGFVVNELKRQITNLKYTYNKECLKINK